MMKEWRKQKKAEDRGRSFWGRYRIAAIGMICFCAVFLSACHGSKGLQSFEIPEEFDENRTYEITFWAKNDTNKNQTDIYEKAIADINLQKKLYKIEMDNLLSTVKKNVETK